MNSSLIPWRHRHKHRFWHRPFRDLAPESLNDSDRWFEGFLDDAIEPRADVSETDDGYKVALELPGMKEDDVDVRVVGDRLIVSGERKHEEEKKRKHFHSREIRYGAFERTFWLPSGVRKDPESISAKFRKGLLEIEIPKVEPEPATKIPVESD